METKKKRIRPIILFLGFYISSMLFQTSSNRSGTIVAFLLIAIIIFSYLKSYLGKTKLTNIGFLTIVFLFFATIVSLLRTGIPPYYVKLVAQALVFILLLGIPKVNEQEEAYLRNAFVLSSLFYAVVGIWGILTLYDNHFHDDIILFGTGIDPNFFGIPIAASATLLLHEIITIKNRKILRFLGYFILIVAIFYTGSRGNFLTLIIGNGLILANFILKKNIKIYKKFFYLVLIVVAALLIFQYVQENFINEWERMTSIGSEGSDNGRFELWRIAIENWKNNPIFGGGMYCNYINNHKAAHNTYLQVLSEEGLFGFAIYMLILKYFLKKTWRYNKAYFIIFVGLMVQIAFLDALENRCVWSVFCWFAVLPNLTEAERTHTYYKEKQ